MALAAGLSRLSRSQHQLPAGSNADAAGEPRARSDAARTMRELTSVTAALGGPFTLTDVDGQRTQSCRDFRGAR